MVLFCRLGILLEKINANPTAIQRLISAAKRNIADAHVESISLENRFDAAYKAIMQLANTALQAHGYRTLTSKPGHHMTMIQTLGQTIGLDRQTMIIQVTLCQGIWLMSVYSMLKGCYEELNPG